MSQFEMPFSPADLMLPIYWTLEAWAQPAKSQPELFGRLTAPREFPCGSPAKVDKLVPKTVLIHHAFLLGEQLWT